MKRNRDTEKMKPYSPEWEREANQLARNSIRIVPCKLCGHPRLDGYICQACSGDDTGDEE